MKKYYTGVRQIYLTNEWIEKILVPVPELTVQKKISKFVTKELDKIGKAEISLKNIERTIFDNLFEKYLRLN